MLPECRQTLIRIFRMWMQSSPTKLFRVDTSQPFLKLSLPKWGIQNATVLRKISVSTIIFWGGGPWWLTNQNHILLVCYIPHDNPKYIPKITPSSVAFLQTAFLLKISQFFTSPRFLNGEIIKSPTATTFFWWCESMDWIKGKFTGKPCI